MDLKNVKELFFELTAIVLPGAVAFLAVWAFVAAPQRFPENAHDIVAANQVPLVFNSAFVSTSILLALAFTCGHAVQHVALWLERKLRERFETPRRDYVGDVFSDGVVRDYLLPWNGPSPFSTSDYFMMAYPAAASRTKRDTFIAVFNFCIGMATALSMVALLTILSFALGPHLDRVLSSGCAVSMTAGVGAILMSRASDYRRFADDIVVNSFLSLLGDDIREANRSSSARRAAME
jgi:hypothetical protein